MSAWHSVVVFQFPEVMTDFRLVSPEFVAEYLEGGSATERCVILEAHFTSEDHPLDPNQPTNLHIPGAVQVHPSYLEAGTNQDKYYPFYDNPEDGNLLPHAELVVALERIGITPDTSVIVYGTQPDGTMAAARVAWGLLYAGVKSVQLLDGGLNSWLRFGGPVVNQIPNATTLRSGERTARKSTSPWGARSEYLASLNLVRQSSDHPHSSNTRLVDVRKMGEWDGTYTDYYTFFSDAGHIPNSIFQGDWELLLDPESRRIEPKLEFVARYWTELGIIDADVLAGRTELIFYCGTGWRSSLSFLVARLLGLKARNFDSGFYGWSWFKGNRIAYDDSPCGKQDRRECLSERVAG